MREWISVTSVSLGRLTQINTLCNLQINVSFMWLQVRVTLLISSFL